MNAAAGGDDWQRREDLLDELLALPPAEREARLAAIGRASADEATALRAWLSGIERSGGYLAANAASAPAAGAAIGAWRLERPLGRGGMGEVWLGARADGLFEKQVAIKFIRDGRAALRRSLESERRVLAGLQHPGIVRLLDAGTGGDGDPYLVTDYIDGVTLDAWLAREPRTLGARVALFRQVAAAVAYAHERLVVHRDIKPANVLVDAADRPHLLDFGIAQALVGESTDVAATLVALTPEYAAPELLSENAASVRSDIYALGGVLYFLLSGKPPLALAGLALAPLVEAIRTHEPPRIAAGVALAGAPRHRVGDLEAIARKALAKEPARRYGSVEALLRDVDATLADLPIAARDGDAWDRTRRYLRRHRIAIGVAATLALALAAGLVGTLWQAREARAQRDRAEAEAVRATAEAATADAVRDFLVGVFQSANPEQTFGRTPTAVELVDDAAREARSGLRDRPELQTQLLDALGRTYMGLGRYAEAVDLLREARTIAVRATGDESALVVRLTVDFAAAVNSHRGPYDEVQPLLEQALTQLKRGSPPDPRLLVAALIQHGEMQVKHGDLNLAIESFENALAQARELGRNGDAERATVLVAFASARTMQNDYPAAITLLREALEIRRQLFAPASPPLVDVQIELADVLRAFDQLDESAAILRQAVAVYREAFGDKHPRTLYARVQLAETLTFQRSFDEADALLHQVDADARQRFGGDNELSRRSLDALAGIRGAQRDAAAGLVYMREAVAMSTRLYGADSPKTLSMAFNLANALTGVGDFAEAQSLSLRVLERYRATGNEDVAGLLSNLGYVARMRGDAQQAAEYHTQAYALISKQTGASTADALSDKLSLALDLRNLDRFDEARATAEAVRDEAQRAGIDADSRVATLSRFVVAQIDTLQGRCSASLPVLEAMWEQYRKLKESPMNRIRAATASLFFGLCRRQNHDGDARAAQALIVDGAKTLRESALAEPWIKRLAAQALDGRAVAAPRVSRSAAPVPASRTTAARAGTAPTR